VSKVHHNCQSEDYSLTSSDGESSLYVKHFFRGNPKTHFFIVHGALEHSGRHKDLTDFWLSTMDDVAVTVFDLVGHGKSGGSRAYLTHFKNYVEDMLIVADFAYKKLPDDCKKFICAHSLGGLITLSRFLDSSFGWPHRCDGMMFSSPCVKPKLLLGASSEPILLRLDKLTPRLHLPMIFKGSQLTRDTKRANDFDTDLLIPRFITVRMMKEILDATHRIRGLSYYMNIPSFFMIAGDDCLVQPDSTTLFAHSIDKKLVTVLQYPQHHHELWNEIDRFEIFANMKKWVEKTLKEKP
jgi:alpha-beta hydrolase superfamily lysophospholipase